MISVGRRTSIPDLDVYKRREIVLIGTEDQNGAAVPAARWSCLGLSEELQRVGIANAAFHGELPIVNRKR